MGTKARFCMRCGTELALRRAAERERLACPAEGCGFVFYDNPLPVVAAIVEHEGEIIVVAQHDWPESWFGLVTGFLEKDETPEQGILRELEEEVGLTGEVVELVGVYAFTMRNELIVAYHVRAKGEIRLGPELRAFKRVPIAKLKPWPFGTGYAVRDWLAKRAQ